MAKTGHPNFVLEYTSLWRGKQHVWRLTSSHSGSAFTAQSDQIAFMQDVHNNVICHFLPANQTVGWFTGAKYYDGQNSAALYDVTYASVAASTAAGWNQGDCLAMQTGSIAGPIEACVVLQAPVGLSKTGKPVFLKKYIHNAPIPGSAGAISDVLPLGSTANATAAKLGDGSLHGARVLCSASGKQGIWSPNPYYGNHQMPRRRKKAATTSGSLLSQAINIAEEAKKLAALVP